MRNDSLQLTHHLGMHARARRATAAKSTAAPLQPACGRGVPHKAQHTYQMRPPPTSRRCPQESAAPFARFVRLQHPSVWSRQQRSWSSQSINPTTNRTWSPKHLNAPVAQWIRRLPTEQEIHGSIPCGGTFNFVFLLGWFQGHLGEAGFRVHWGEAVCLGLAFCFLSFTVYIVIHTHTAVINIIIITHIDPWDLPGPYL